MFTNTYTYTHTHTHMFTNTYTYTHTNPSSFNLSQLVTAHIIYRKALKYNKINYIKNIIKTNYKDYKKLYNTISMLMILNCTLT